MRDAALAGFAFLLFAYAYRALLHGEIQPSSHLTQLEDFFFSPSGGSPALVFMASAWMMTTRWRRLRSTLGRRTRPWLGSLMLGAAAACFVWAHYVSAPVLFIPSLSMLLLGIALVIGGGAGARSVLLPALFLFFAVPIPSVLLNRLIYPLQLATAGWTTAILNAVGLATVSNVEFILRKDAVFQVIESCAGLRMIETLLMSAVLYCELFRTSWARTAIVVAAAPVIGVVCNQFRVVSIVLNPYSSFAAVHSAQGLVMIVVGVLLLAVVDSAAARLLGHRDGGPRKWRIRRRPGTPSSVALVGLVAVASGFVLGSTMIRPWEAPPAPPSLSSRVPGQIDGWSVSGLETDKRFLGSARFDDAFSRRYQRGDEYVDLFVARDLRLDPSRSLISQKTELPGARYAVLERAPIRLLERNIFSLVVSSGAHEQLVYSMRFGTDSFGRELFREAFSLDRGLLRRPGYTLVVRINTPMGRGAAARSAAEKRLAEFLATVEGPLLDLIREAEGAPGTAGLR